MELCDITLFDHYVHSPFLDEWCYQEKEIVVAEQPSAECFGSFAGFEILVHVLVIYLVQHSFPDLFKDDVFQGVVHHSTDCPSSTKVGCVEEFLNSFPIMPGMVSNALDLQLDFISN